MYFRQAEHNPPHFHVIYGEYLAEIDIKTGEMLVGDLPGIAAAGVVWHPMMERAQQCFTEYRA